MEIIIAEILFALALAAAALSFLLPKRQGIVARQWGPARAFALLRTKLEDFGLGKPSATLATECVSGILHAPVAYLFVHQFPGSEPASCRWAAVVAFIFWFGFGTGRAALLDNQMRRRVVKATADEAVSAFLENPLPGLAGYGGADPWGDEACADIIVRSMGWTLGYVQRIKIQRAAGVASIGHIAVETGFERRRIGRRLALALRAELAWRYGVTRILFCEDSSRYDEARYAKFFVSLGATQQETPQTKPGRGDWLWT